MQYGLFKLNGHSSWDTLPQWAFLKGLKSTSKVCLHNCSGYFLVKLTIEINCHSLHYSKKQLYFSLPMSVDFCSTKHITQQNSPILGGLWTKRKIWATILELILVKDDIFILSLAVVWFVDWFEVGEGGLSQASVLPSQFPSIKRVIFHLQAAEEERAQCLTLRCLTVSAST